MDVWTILAHANVTTARGAFVATAVAIALGTSGCGDGTVPARGYVNIEGERATGGRLMLRPNGEGTPAFSLIAQDGAFALHTGGKKLGAFPGSYRVSLQLPLEGALRERVARELAGEVRIDELSVSYRNPSEAPLTIPDEGDEAIVIDVRQSDGWIRSLNE